jgi:hypothetical protein
MLTVKQAQEREEMYKRFKDDAFHFMIQVLQDMKLSTIRGEWPDGTDDGLVEATLEFSNNTGSFRAGELAWDVIQYEWEQRVAKLCNI